MPLFSIIIPVYNIEKYLSKCLDSVCEQTCADYEVILVNDGSTDNSGHICEIYKQKNDKFKVYHKKNEGIVKTRQFGVANAAGKYIVCIDGDDWISEDYLEQFEKEIEKNTPDVICCGYVIASEQKNKPMPISNNKGYYSRAKMELEIFPMLIQSSKATYFRPSLWAKAIKRELYIQQQFTDLFVNIGEDGACTIPCIAHAKSMSILQECMYFYRLNISSVTKAKKPFRWDGPMLISKHLENRIDMTKYDFQEQLYRKTVHELFTVVITQFYQNKTRKEIVKDIDKHLSEEYYANAIKNSSFKGSLKANFMYYSLRFKIYWIIALYAKYKKGR